MVFGGLGLVLGSGSGAFVSPVFIRKVFRNEVRYDGLALVWELVFEQSYYQD